VPPDHGKHQAAVVADVLALIEGIQQVRHHLALA
jgi:hypothetical protein